MHPPHSPGREIREMTMNDSAIAKLGPNAKELFALYVSDSGNWGGTPMVGGNVTLLGDREDRGLLTHLKKAGLITTFKQDREDGGNTFVEFTSEGRAYAVELGLEPPEAAAL